MDVSTIRKRAAIQRTRRVAASAIEPLLDTRWLAIKLREERFDTRLARGVR